MYLRFSSVTKRYGQVVAVDNVSFTVEKGELVSLLGPSGCGKSTTLLMLAGFEQPDAGAIELDGKNLAGVAPERRSVGLVFQHYALFPHMTVAENVAFGLTRGGKRVLSRHEVSARVRELLEMVDLADLAQRKPAELSAGQQQRVAIARSLAPQPLVLCLDEPLSALDAILRERLRLEIRQLQRNLRLTVIYVTHDQEEALAISDKVVVMQQGSVAQVGTAWDVYDRPANRFVASFIGAGSILEGRLLSDDSDQFTVHLVDGSSVDLPSEVWSDSEAPKTGQRVAVVVRAERAQVVVDSEPPPMPGAVSLNAQLHEVEFLGGWVGLHLQGACGSMTATAPAVDFHLWQERVGARVRFAFSPKDARMVRAKHVS